VIGTFGEFEIDAALFELRRDGQRVPIEPKVFDLLSYLVRHSQRVVTRDEIFAAVWPNECVSDAALAYAIRGARKAIGDDGRQQRLIRTVQRRGFHFVGDVVRTPDLAAPPAAVPAAAAPPSGRPPPLRRRPPAPPRPPPPPPQEGPPEKTRVW
jgi:DNA-binding winged helix-turn-helix (wHTH) protein